MFSSTSIHPGSSPSLYPPKFMFTFSLSLINKQNIQKQKKTIQTPTKMENKIYKQKTNKKEPVAAPTRSAQIKTKPLYLMHSSSPSLTSSRVRKAFFWMFNQKQVNLVDDYNQIFFWAKHPCSFLEEHCGFLGEEYSVFGSSYLPLVFYFLRSEVILDPFKATWMPGWCSPTTSIQVRWSEEHLLEFST